MASNLACVLSAQDFSIAHMRVSTNARSLEPLVEKLSLASATLSPR